MQYNVITDYLDHWAEHEPDTVWLRELKESDSSEHTWAECRQQVATVAAALEKRFGHGTRMLLLSRNCPHWFLADLAIIRSGNVTVPLFTTHPPSTAGYIAEFTESTVRHKITSCKCTARYRKKTLCKRGTKASIYRLPQQIIDNILAKSEGQNGPNLAPTRAKFVLSRPFLCKDLA